MHRRRLRKCPGDTGSKTRRQGHVTQRHARVQRGLRARSDSDITNRRVLGLRGWTSTLVGWRQARMVISLADALEQFVLASRAGSLRWMQESPEARLRWGLTPLNEEVADQLAAAFRTAAGTYQGGCGPEGGDPVRGPDGETGMEKEHVERWAADLADLSTEPFARIEAVQHERLTDMMHYMRAQHRRLIMYARAHGLSPFSHFGNALANSGPIVQFSTSGNDLITSRIALTPSNLLVLHSLTLGLDNSIIKPGATPARSLTGAFGASGFIPY
ncbi:hypothetical protein VOLCADRAFT_108007 [Volvox carteri f. nagariensis]|uniref:Uncharacterized protein n=1 Tax=Volvox carteri f. nagariensis TaxID=3068 RepID=D8UHQ1_VOLCA|nr:uncharacterized protein VOLCADRAFT_108007 [Volvox carteri f. nagariensis]EFJ40745.1 hypothetical protein VOLCADRAFT_108007 [Volvox carteri f. nagariensis]|eukprot:XP_002958211.1 hypothetical protein VOLCADRAFT_108007 [Volvox carteri f. nagariensis]